MYGNPEDVLSAKQTQQAKDQQRQRRTLHARKEWSDARKAAEALFDFPAPEAARPSTPAAPRNGDFAGNGRDSA